MSRIYWDSMLFIYWIEDHPVHAATVERIARSMRARGDVLYTSVFTLGEVLVAPLKQGRTDIEKRVRALFQDSIVTLVPMTASTAYQYASIRAGKAVTPPDAIHLASAAEAEVDLFLTNDRRLQGLSVQGIDFIAGMDVNLF
jgi:uncharacterized protein